MTPIHAYAATEAGGPLAPFEYEPGTLGDRQVEVAVQYCGICHSDLSMLNNDWGITTYPFVPGHEIVGTVQAIGDRVEGLEIGQTVGVGWFSGSCLRCEWCMDGYYNLCTSAEQIIVGRYGGFANRVRANAEWVFPLPADLDLTKAGPLFCGGITVFSPLVEFDIAPTAQVGIIGIGGLGHLALQFTRAWGCRVTAFSSNVAKTDEIKAMGADQVINSRDRAALEAAAGQFDLIICTANANLDWDLYIQALRPKGRLHFVGVVPDAISTQAFSLIAGQKSISGSPLGTPSTIAKMLDFATHHHIAPITEHFPMTDVNAAIAHLKAGKARYRIVLQA